MAIKPGNPEKSGIAWNLTITPEKNWNFVQKSWKNLEFKRKIKKETFSQNKSFSNSNHMKIN